MIKTFKNEFSSIKIWVFPLLVIIYLPCGIINHFSNSKWFCSFWGWHKEPKLMGFDGCSATGKCPRCNKDVLLDSQGNWF